MATPEDKYTTETITHLRRWTDTLISFRLTRPAGFRFTAGQFARLGLQTETGEAVWRAYSMVSAVWEEYLEFFSIVVPNGAFTSRLCRKTEGDTLWLDKTATGFFTLNRFPDGRDLWLLATGTGLAPYLSILQDPDVWSRFEHIVLVHSVRHTAELAYREEIAALPQHPLWAEQGHKFRYLPVVTREPAAGRLSARIPQLLASHALEEAAGLALSPAHSRLMLCGNPQMVEDTHRQLKEMGYRLSRLSAPAQLAVENGW